MFKKVINIEDEQFSQYHGMNQYKNYVLAKKYLGKDSVFLRVSEVFLRQEIIRDIIFIKGFKKMFMGFAAINCMISVFSIPFSVLFSLVSFAVLSSEWKGSGLLNSMMNKFLYKRLIQDSLISEVTENKNFFKETIEKHSYLDQNDLKTLARHIVEKNNIEIMNSLLSLYEKIIREEKQIEINNLVNGGTINGNMSKLKEKTLNML